ncbi:MAG: hypothetical protein QXM04_02245 [Nanopusillaceae archaeon]
MISSKDLIKNFENFCKLSGGRFENTLNPKCIKSSFSISLEVTESNGIFEKIILKIESISGDNEVIKLKNVKIIDLEKFSEEDEKGIYSYYTFNIITDKGVLSLKRAIREDKLIILYRNDTIEYESSIIF